MKHSIRWFAAACGGLVLAAHAGAQTVYGTPGAPSATQSIAGDRLPAPPGKFGGTIGKTAAQSKPYWQPRIVPP